MITRVFKSFFISLLCVVLVGCSQDDDNNQSLPPETQIGAGTFACKVNGKSFIDTSRGYFNCYYQYIDGGYYFGIQGDDRVGSFISVNIGTEKKEIKENETYKLMDIVPNNAWAGSSFNPNSTSQIFTTTNSKYTGELYISKFDLVNNIVSGTFWYDIENPYTGEIVEIREGRFDTLFTE